MLEFVIGYSVASKGQARASSLARSMEVAQGNNQSSRIEKVNEKVDNLGVIIKAMWSLLEEQGMTADQLMDRIEQIQAEDIKAAADGVPKAARCRSCDSMVAIGLAKCQICGAQMETRDRDPLDLI